jgi:hypothetical protein
LNEHEQKNSGRRDFDWGPPANSFIETIKEWLVYILLMILLGLGIWFFIDISSRKTQAVRIAPVTANKVANSQKALPATVDSKSQTKNAGFLVQLGAFADRKTAENAIISLQSHGFAPKLSEPDSEIEIYRVSVGPFNNEEEAEKTVEKLNSLEFHSFVVECF